MSDKTKNTVINFSENVKKLTLKKEQEAMAKHPANSEEQYKPLTNDELMTLGTDEFLEDVKKAHAFIAISFDEQNRPSILHVGDIDLINAVGALEYAKKEILDNSFNESDDDHDTDI